MAALSEVLGRGFSVILPATESATQDRNRAVKQFFVILLKAFTSPVPLKVSQMTGLEPGVVCNRSPGFNCSFLLPICPHSIHIAVTYS